MSDELVEKVARAICLIDEQNGGAPWEYHQARQPSAIAIYRETATAAIAAALEEAAKVAEGVWWQGHGNLTTEPYAAAKQAGDEIAAVIRAMIEKIETPKDT